MAHVAGGDRRDRAQMILVSGLLVGITLLVLVLLLNTVIYTDNVATRGIDSDAGAAIDYQRMIETELASYFEAENADVDAADWEEFEPTVERGVDHVLGHRHNLSLEQGHIKESEVRLRPGLYAERESVSTFEETTIANESVEARNFTVTIASDGDVSVEAVGDGTWSVDIQRTDGEVIIVGEEVDTCDENLTFSGNVTIDFINETVTDDDGSTDCSGDFWGDDGRPPNVDDEFAIGFGSFLLEDSPEGMFRLEAKVTLAETYEHNLASPIVYEAEVELTYLSADLRYETITTVEGPVP